MLPVLEVKPVALRVSVINQLLPWTYLLQSSHAVQILVTARIHVVCGLIRKASNLVCWLSQLLILLLSLRNVLVVLSLIEQLILRPESLWRWII